MKISNSYPCRIFLVGFSGCGKSTIGKKLAQKLDYQFVDTDTLLEEQTKMSIADFFEQNGESAFRKKEYELLSSLLSAENCVIATGGGFPCNRDAMGVMMNSGLVIYIYMPPSALYHRIKCSKTERPLLKKYADNELPDVIRKMLQARKSCYLKAHHIINGLDFKSNLRDLCDYLFE